MERCESGRIGLPAKELYPKRVPGVRIPPSPDVPIAQLDRVSDCGSDGRRFESSWARELERCESGRIGRTRNPLYRASGTEGSNPSLSVPLAIPGGLTHEQGARKGLLRKVQPLRKRRGQRFDRGVRGRGKSDRERCLKARSCRERCPRGRRSTLGKCVYPNRVPRVRIPLSPDYPFSALVRFRAICCHPTPSGPEGSSGK